MLVETAIDLVNQLVLWPGWKLSATDHTKRFEGAIVVRVDYPAVNTDRDNARDGYDRDIVTYATFPIVVGDCNNVDTLYRKVLNAIVKIQVHEAREALRVQPTYWAPFHPHKIDGMKRWKDTEGACDTAIMDDMQFGIG